jgi:hypothetical protein
MSETPYVLTTKFDDGQGETSAYQSLERATWNFTDAILKKYTLNAKITMDGGKTVIAMWTRPHESLPTIAELEQILARETTCTCWLGTTATYGDSKQRERCAVHGSQQQDAPNAAAGPIRTTDELWEIVKRLDDALPPGDRMDLNRLAEAARR